MFFLRVLEKIKEIIVTFSEGSITVLQIMATYQEARVKPTNTKLKNLKYIAKKKDRNIIKNN